MNDTFWQSVQTNKQPTNIIISCTRFSNRIVQLSNESESHTYHTQYHPLPASNRTLLNLPMFTAHLTPNPTINLLVLSLTYQPTYLPRSPHPYTTALATPSPPLLLPPLYPLHPLTIDTQKVHDPTILQAFDYQKSKTPSWNMTRYGGEIDWWDGGLEWGGERGREREGERERGREGERGITRFGLASMIVLRRSPSTLMTAS